MRVARLVLAIFPLTLIGALAAERCALLWLGADPASPLAWAFWLNAHAAFGRAWQAVEPGIGGTVPGHLLALFLLATIVLMLARSRRWASYSFVGNHLALIVAIASFLMGSQAKVSSLAGEFPYPGNWAVIWMAHLSPVQLIILLGGLASCVLCHLAVLHLLGGRSAAVSLRVRMLQQNL